jgi:hypothetical protein
MKALKKLAKNVLHRFGYEIRREGGLGMIPECGPEDLALLKSVAPYTMLAVESRWAMLQACRHVKRSAVPGAIVECGVWRGGAMMLAARAFAKDPRDLVLFDTFAGMTRPTEHDTQDGGRPAMPDWEGSRRGNIVDWCYASLEDVRANLAGTNYPMSRVRLVEGPVESTLRDEKNLPREIALLRLDTDFYESTAAELEVLYPRLSRNGVLIVDDYGHWSGSRKAVDEYFSGSRTPPLLLQVGGTGARIAVKTPA